MPAEEIYKIINRETGGEEGSYERGNYTKYEFGSPSSARSSNCHGIYEDKTKYKIQKYKVTYELVEDDVDPPTQEEIEAAKKKEQLWAKAREKTDNVFKQAFYVALMEGK